ncbi:MAG TPA: hypothetical protein VFE90_17610 [Myxococcales bacterium]|nr:hypothetical protein [Myxococcales bacterium]
MRQPDGDQVGPHGPVPGLLRLSRLQEHQGLHRGGWEDQGGGGHPHRRGLPDLRKGDGEQARTLRPLPRLQRLPHLQDDAPHHLEGRGLS